MDALRKHVDFELIRHLVARDLGICPITGRTDVDVRTCWVLRDSDGDPHMVMSPGAWDEVSDPVAKQQILDLGYTLDTRTA